jgi:hypothetical protein
LDDLLALLLDTSRQTHHSYAQRLRHLFSAADVAQRGGLRLDE